MPTSVRYTVVDGEVIAEKRSGVRKEYVPDPLGSTVALLDNTQAQTDTFGFWPYGEVASRTGTTPTPYQHVGTLGYYTDYANRSYVDHRVLNKAHGRWMTQDPIGFEGRDWNLYRYVANRPTTMVDIWGTSTYMCTVGWYLGIPAHRFISTHLCGAYGFHPSGSQICSPGQVLPDDPYLKPDPNYPPFDPRDIGRTHGHFIPGQGGKSPGGNTTGFPVTCVKISDDPNFERAICNCMEKSILVRADFRCESHNCQHWTKEMLDCACGPGKEWWGFGCNTIIIIPPAFYF